MSNQPSNLRLVTRYSNWCAASHGHDLMAKPEGPWVLFSDYAAEKARADFNFEENERLRTALAACQTYDYRTLAAEIERLSAESEARHQSCLVLMKSVQDHRAEIERLRAALEQIQQLYFDSVGTMLTVEHFIEGARIARRALQGETGLPEVPQCKEPGCSLYVESGYVYCSDHADKYFSPETGGNDGK